MPVPKKNRENVTKCKMHVCHACVCTKTWEQNQQSLASLFLSFMFKMREWREREKGKTCVWCGVMGERGEG